MTTLKKFKKMFCVFIGHSRIFEGCFGYFSCARCGEQLGDAVAGMGPSQYGDHVMYECNCAKCWKSWEKMDWKDTMFVPFPFEKDENGEYRIISREERRQQLNKRRLSIDI